MWSKAGIGYNVFVIIITVVRGHDFRNFDDSVIFKLNWPGEPIDDLSEPKPNVESYFITSANNEKYQCLIPEPLEPKQDYTETYTGPNAIEILFALFDQISCSYRLDAYWTYELCHGRYVRQYHEDRDGKKVKTQEYYLGTFDKTQRLKLLAEYEKKEKSPNGLTDIPAKKVDGINMPYVEVEMGDGTVCDLTNVPRKIKVLYVCFQHGKHEIFSLEETYSCEYEAIVLSPLLCAHPAYRPQDTEENEIDCRPVDNAPKKPRALVAMETESVILRHQKPTDGEARVRVEIHPVDVIDKHNIVDESINSLTGQGMSPAEVSPVQSFLSGKNCLHGGNGWWKYEFCYGRSVMQYHVERDGSKTVVNLGNFDKQKHLEWIAAHPQNKPKPLFSRKYLSHFYSDGTICDKTGNPRQTEVKLKCVENHMASLSSVSLFLLEPKTCEYVLGVESPLICDILKYADENGLLSEQFEVNFGNLKTTAFQVEQDDLQERIANGDD